MELVQTLDDYGKPAWIALMVVSFIIFWPIGLAILFYLIWSGRMGCRSMGCGSRNWKNKAEEKWNRARTAFHSTGNAAFDEYREETLRRLESEADEFQAFLKRLRAARDKAEFDEFMTERGSSKGKSEDNSDAAPQTG